MDQSTGRVPLWVGILILGVFTVVLIFILLAYVGTAYANLTIYPVQCNGWFEEGVPSNPTFDYCTKRKALARQSFQADPQNQTVIQTSPDTADVIKLKACTVQDSAHWSCGDGKTFPGGMLAASSISWSAGRFLEQGLTNVIFVTEEQWSSVSSGAPSPICNGHWCD